MKRKLVVLVMMMALLITAAPMLADGAASYKAKCAMCHGPDGAGQTTMGKNMKLRDLGSAEVQKATDAEWTKLITDGKGKMPAYKGKLSDAEIKDVVAFMRTFKK